MASSIFVLNGGVLTVGTQSLFPSGSAGAPSLAFTSDTTKGLYNPGVDQVGISLQGALRFLFSPTANLFIRADTGSVNFGSGDDTALTRTAAGKLSITGTTPMLQLGGTTASFPALRRTNTQTDFVLADASAFSPIKASVIQAEANYSGGINNTLLVSFTAPTISSGFGTSPSIATNNGTAAFTINVGTGAVASSGVIGLPAATNGWVCYVQNLTAQAANRANERTVQTATTTTTVTVQNQLVSTGAAQAWAASDILHIICMAR